MNKLMPRKHADAIQYESTEQMELLQASHQELEQALETLQNLKPDEREDFTKRWPSTLQSLCELMRVTLEGQAISNAVQISEALATTLSTYLGGRDIYIPNGERLKDALRDIRIWREFKGNNLEQLSRDYSLTERRVSQIIAEQRAAFVARKQRRLF
ncbi:Mor transcription activator family protein [Shewanella fidelis]|uniref:Transcriptional regulator n=1 Tax=Shewanella fidelis TaxID=173509 RepID=A0AAW8NMP3_9GAMM|nr:Mor transcription activator family protein [Shewanella fidelis]MDR8523451.1 transcriptional regulator [Shewanella fidelis]MDW4813315.1 transcriptional regulator [Shewanella fidelis]MDW4817313.1 transcriptional regulator [Shewanella fidelis]MDW4821330.1 transcriptional regulator [Shewanella fidelis]MDW4824592.1 transcriptional regulator [Shewanella fidelis]